MFVVLNYGANLKVEEKELNVDWLVKEKQVPTEGVQYNNI